MVAAPRLREGEELLTPGGKETILRAGQQAREQSAAAAGNTWHWVASLRSRLSVLWSPASRALHEQFDRLEGQPGSQPPVRHRTGPQTASDVDQEPLMAPLAPATGTPVVGRPRPMPDESGPIPLEDDDASSRHPAVDQEPSVINLRGTEPGPAPAQPGRISPDVTTRRIR